MTGIKKSQDEKITKKDKRHCTHKEFFLKY